MLLSIGLIALGFLLGAGVTGIIALQLFGILHAEAVRVVDSHGVMLFSGLP
ncbi:hypothetical protein L288_17750 [Sphingobium quisquiliarum P25]|uniref:Uncharacterized protein n=1 Tax=Sphingobium quisquiliarum P25 TaxID=1329909 RepID=T0HQL1_9SPHN|nr:hypothetical protein [Sphingobium quisquiliarum]EQB01615.1 hypothetical protein L288_17750 [Sphingobium quisquiliarum P25]